MNYKYNLQVSMEGPFHWERMELVFEPGFSGGGICSAIYIYSLLSLRSNCIQAGLVVLDILQP